MRSSLVSTGNSDFLTVIKVRRENLAVETALNLLIHSDQLLPQMRNTMLTATHPNALTDLTTLSPLNSSTNLTVRANPETTFAKYQQFRNVIPELINTNSSELFYRSYENEPDSFNGDGLHEKFIHQGQSILDISMGQLDFPWHAADANPANEISQSQLQFMAANETDPLIVHRLQVLSNLASFLPPTPFTRYYHYQGMDGVRALTVCDDINSVKLNVILTYTEELVF